MAPRRNFLHYFNFKEEAITLFQPSRADLDMPETQSISIYEYIKRLHFKFALASY